MVQFRSGSHYYQASLHLGVERRAIQTQASGLSPIHFFRFLNFFFLLWESIHNIKFSILTIFKCKIQWHWLYSMLCSHHHYLPPKFFTPINFFFYGEDSFSFFPSCIEIWLTYNIVLKVYNIMIWPMHILWNDYHDKFSYLQFTFKQAWASSTSVLTTHEPDCLLWLLTWTLRDQAPLLKQMMLLTPCIKMSTEGKNNLLSKNLCS